MPCRLAIPLTDLSIISDSYLFVKSKKQFFRLFFQASLREGGGPPQVVEGECVQLSVLLPKTVFA